VSVRSDASTRPPNLTSASWPSKVTTSCQSSPTDRLWQFAAKQVNPFLNNHVQSSPISPPSDPDLWPGSFYPPQFCLQLLQGLFPANYHTKFGLKKLEYLGNPVVKTEDPFIISFNVLRPCDGQTDRHTDTALIVPYALHSCINTVYKNYRLYKNTTKKTEWIICSSKLHMSLLNKDHLTQIPLQ